MREISDALPGADLIRQGLQDLDAGVESVPAMLVLVGAPRLRRLGISVEDSPFFPAAECVSPETRTASASSCECWQRAQAQLSSPLGAPLNAGGLERPPLHRFVPLRL